MGNETPSRYGLFDWTVFSCFSVVMLSGAVRMVMTSGSDNDTGFAIIFAGALGLLAGRLLKSRGDTYGK